MKPIACLLISLICLLAGSLTAQSSKLSKPEIESSLMYEWIHSPTSATVDQYASGKCESGKSYIFASGGVLEIRECVNNHMRSIKQTWTLNQTESGDWQINLSGIVYSLEIKATPGKKSLVLVPSVPQDGKADPTTSPLTNISLYRLDPQVSDEEIEEEPE
jgi:hypothetical protein